MWQVTRTGFKGTPTSSASHRWDNRWGLLYKHSACCARPQRNPMYRPSALNNRRKVLQFPCLIPYELYTHALPVKKWWLQLTSCTWIHSHPSFHFDRAQGQHWISFSTCRGKTRQWRPRWYDIVRLKLNSVDLYLGLCSRSVYISGMLNEHRLIDDP